MTDRMDDTEFMHSVLADGEWHGQMEIIGRSVEERGYGLTPHSRASTLRERGFVVQNRQHVVNGRRVSEYRLVLSLDESAESPVDSVGLAGSSNGTVREVEGDSDGHHTDGAPQPLGPLPLGPSAYLGDAEPVCSPPEHEGPAQQLSVWEAA